ncbi:H/ACA ribonucleoprotein complex subunit GAR1 [Penicillium diatomitis]|uniref:H/ACA ribonucleoprotein complex subunit n=1 Tax=Penicillium diatomitis TaxID=2819901 RepID=A0A9W9X438_9EURO|nr:H/ACA ribonucleoprotein complex subunit GAR1 [Penicillium diatomitis]KAJ5482869.1 H/ACA ribonucleoprotein complex subunit GAR1 [Penicillium diatomitis]
MSFRGRGTGANRGGFGSRGGRGGFQPSFGPPAQVLEMGTVMHACEGEMVCESINPKIPYFNAPIYLENKTPIGKVDEVLGPINQVYFTIKPQEGIVATSFKPGDKVYIGGDKLLPLEKFLPKPKPPPGAAKPKRAGGARGGRGGAPRGRGGFGGRGGAPVAVADSVLPVVGVVVVASVVVEVASLAVAVAASAVVAALVAASVVVVEVQC